MREQHRYARLELAGSIRAALLPQTLLPQACGGQEELLLAASCQASAKDTARSRTEWLRNCNILQLLNVPAVSPAAHSATGARFPRAAPCCNVSSIRQHQGQTAPVQTGAATGRGNLCWAAAFDSSCALSTLHSLHQPASLLYKVQLYEVKITIPFQSEQCWMYTGSGKCPEQIASASLSPVTDAGSNCRHACALPRRASRRQPVAVPHRAAASQPALLRERARRNLANTKGYSRW